MGNCVSVNKKKVEPKKSITLAIVGLDNAGKTTLSSVLSGDQPDPDIAPTVGFRNVKFTSLNCDVTAFDVGGGKNIRNIWKTYFAEVFGVLFVVDSSCGPRMKEAREVFKETLGNPKVCGKPVLILANKVDKADHLKETDLFKALDIEKTVNSNNCPSKMVMVSALKGVGPKMDKEIAEGLTWLLNEIKKSWATLSPRVQEDVAAEKETKEKERDERRARVKKQREEREKSEQLERTALGLGKKEESDEEDFEDGNPFKALDLAKLEKKEKMLKEEKYLKEKKLLQLGRGDNLRQSLGEPRARKNLGNISARRSMDDLDMIKSSTFSPERVSPGSKMGLTSFDLAESVKLRKDSSEGRAGSLSLFGRNGRGQNLPPLGPSAQQDSNEKKFRKKKKRLTDYNLSGSDVDDVHNKENSSWNSRPFHQESGLWSRESEVHEMTPRMTKPRLTKIGKPSKIDEEEEGYSNRDRFKNSKADEDEDPRSHQLAVQPYSVNKLGKESGRKGYETFPHDLDREDSTYRKTLRRISPPNLKGFDEERDGEDSTEKDDISDYEKDRFVSRENQRNMNKKRGGDNNNRKLASLRHMNDIEQDGGYSRDSVLKDTLRFPRSPRGDEDDSGRDSEDSPRDLQKEIREVQQRYGNGLLNGRSSSLKKGLYNELSVKKSLELKQKDNKDESDYSGRPETRRKKKRNFFRSNKLAPSDDDDADSSVGDRVGSPQLVKEAVRHENPTKNSNSRVTQLHRNVPKESVPQETNDINVMSTIVKRSKKNLNISDLSSKWGLAEELPSIDDDYSVRRIPNFDDSDADDIVF